MFQLIHAHIVQLSHDLYLQPDSLVVELLLYIMIITAPSLPLTPSPYVTSLLTTSSRSPGHLFNYCAMHDAIFSGLQPKSARDHGPLNYFVRPHTRVIISSLYEYVRRVRDAEHSDNEARLRYAFEILSALKFHLYYREVIDDFPHATNDRLNLVDVLLHASNFKRSPT